MATPSKNEAIKATMKATRERHAGMLCRVYEVKVVASKLSRQKKELINQLFREAKWLRNSELAKGDPKAMDRDAKTAVVKVGDVFETRELTLLGSQIRQDIVELHPAASARDDVSYRQRPQYHFNSGNGKISSEGSRSRADS